MALLVMSLKIKKKSKSCAGFSLVETMIAVLLISVVVTSVFSLALTSKASSINTDRRSAALYAITQAREQLKAYVTADRDGSVTSPTSNWKMPGDACTPTTSGRGGPVTAPARGSNGTAIKSEPTTYTKCPLAT